MGSHHHRSHLQDYEEDNLSELYHPSIKNFLSNYFPINAIDFERNLSNIEETILSIFQPNPAL